MARPSKCRFICRMPAHREFAPRGRESRETVILTVDEYEALRLVDLEGMTQEECAGQMGVSRPSVCAILESARRKVADMIVGGKGMRIEGGTVTVCDHGEMCREHCRCRCRRCVKPGGC